MVNQLFERQPKYLLIDELDKMVGNDQTSLLHLMETGIISETKVRKTREIELTSWVFATCNNSDKIKGPLLSRFVVLGVPDYSYEEFVRIAVTSLGKENIDKFTAAFIAKKVWHEMESQDIRDIVKVGRLATDSREISKIIEIIKKHTCI